MLDSNLNQEKLYLDLFSFGQSIFASVDIDQLVPEILQWVVARTKAERCRIILYGEEGALVNRGNDADPKVSSKIVEMVKSSHQVFVSANAMEDERLQESLQKSQTIFRQKLLSVACAPIREPHRVFGVVYIDNRDEQAVFDDNTGQLLQALADLMSAALKKSLENTLRRQQEADRLKSELHELRKEIDDLKGYGEMLGTGAAIQKVYQDIQKKTINNTANVLVTGESGTGKELAARTIHKKGSRFQQPFVVIDCSTLNESTIESELFGHEKGAFTDARERKPGLIEMANGGTLFIDEIGNIHLELQQKLLRVLESKALYRVGGTAPVAVDVRFIFATNENLQELAAKNKFRKDLYYRITEGVHIHLPPLRERGNDILLIAGKLLQEFSEKNKKRVVNLAAPAQEILLRYAYPGNVRELRRLMLNAVLDAKEDTVHPQDLLPYIRGEAIPSLETDFAPNLTKAQALLYASYLPAAYRTSFIWGIGAEHQDADRFKDQDDAAILKAIQHELHEKIIIDLKSALDMPLAIATEAVATAFERNFIIAKLMETNGKVLDAAQKCHVDKKTLINKAKKYGLKKEWYVG